MADRTGTPAPLQPADYGRQAYVGARPLDRPDLKVDAQRKFALGDVFLRVADAAQAKLTENAVAHAQREGAALGGLNTKKVTIVKNGKPVDLEVPTLTRAEGTGAMARAWNQAAETAFAMRLDTATMREVSRAAAENPADPDGIVRDLDAFKSGIIDVVPADMMPRYERDLFAMAQPLITKAERDKMQNIANDQAIVAQMAADELVGHMVINSGLGAEGAAVGAAQFKNFVDATQSRIGPYFSEAEAQQAIRNVLAEAAIGSLQATFEAAPDKRAAMDAFMAGKPMVSLPAVGEDGEVQAGLYDRNTLITLIGPDKVQSLVNGLATDIRMQEAEQRARAAEARAAENERLAALQTNVQLGFDDAVAEAQVTGRAPMSAADIYAAYPGEKHRKTAEKLVAKLELAAQSGSVRKVIAGNSPEDDAAYIEGLKPVPGTADFAEQQALYNLALAERDQKVKMLTSDPASYVLQTNSAVQAAWAAAGEGDPAAVKQAVAATKQAQAALGVPPERVQAMPAGQASQLASTITTATPDAVAATVDSIAATYGADGLNQVIGAGVPPMVKAVAFADMPDQAGWRAKAAQAMQIKESDLKAQAEARNVTSSDINAALENVLPPLLDAIPPASAAPYVDAVRQVALYNVAIGGMDADEAAADAFSVFDKAYVFQGTYRVPRRYDADAVAAGAADLIGRLDLYDVAPAVAGGPGLDPAFLKTETINAIKNGRYRWVTDRTDDALILTYEEGNPVMVRRDLQGPLEPLRVTFEELLLLGQGQPAPGSMIEQLRGTTGAN